MEKIITGNANRNTFVIINQDTDHINAIAIKNLCSKFKTDGLLNLNYKNKRSIKLDYYNNDGTWETFCINGLTCAALILHNELFKKEFNVLCGSGKYKIKIIEKKLVEIEIPNPIYKTNKDKPPIKKKKRQTFHDPNFAIMSSGRKHQTFLNTRRGTKKRESTCSSS